MQFLSVIFVVIALMAAVAESVNLIGTISVPSDSSHSAGVYWVGSDSIESRLVTDMPWLGNSDAEHLITVIVPGSEMSESVKPGSAFTIRSADFTSRVRLTLSMNPDAPDEDSSIEHLPYVIKIVNLAMEDRTGPYPLELKHGNAGYVWIDPTEYVEHLTGVDHEFEIRDRDHHPVFSFKIQGHVAEEL